MTSGSNSDDLIHVKRVFDDLQPLNDSGAVSVQRLLASLSLNSDVSATVRTLAYPHLHHCPHPQVQNMMRNGAFPCLLNAILSAGRDNLLTWKDLMTEMHRYPQQSRISRLDEEMKPSDITQVCESVSSYE